jgi:4-hydroxy-tetrahydrodipicolinate reductase
MAITRVLVTGASGRMAREVIAAVAQEADLALAGAVSRQPDSSHLTLASGSRLPLYRDLTRAIEDARPDVVVDFTHPDATAHAVQAALPRRVAMVVGTSNLSETTRGDLERLCTEHRVGAILAPNFAIGAVLLMHLARMAAPYFESAEIIELHHDAKADAPSGTALATAQAMVAARERPFARAQTQKQTLPETRGGAWEGVTIHSVRLPGLVAHQEVLFGTRGQTLTLRHDSMSRESFMPGVLLAIRKVRELDRLVVGLEPLLGLAPLQPAR